MTMLAEPIVLPFRGTRRGIMANAEPLPDGWENGISFLPVDCAQPNLVVPCVVTDTTEVRPGTAVVFEPITVQQTAACAMMSKIRSADIAARRLDGTTEWALGQLLATGAGSMNPSFADAAVVHEAQAINQPGETIRAVSCLEAAAADVGFGADAVLHAPVSAAAWLRASGVMDDDGLSPAGYQWIISPGYPAGPLADDTVTVTIWATGSVFASVSPVRRLDDVTGWRHNTDSAYADRLALAVFDPCINFASQFLIPECIQGAG